MNLNNLKKTTKSSKKRVGRGYGSGKGGHTSGRGSKGAKSRGKIPLDFSGTKSKKSTFQKDYLCKEVRKTKGYQKQTFDS